MTIEKAKPFFVLGIAALALLVISAIIVTRNKPQCIYPGNHSANGEIDRQLGLSVEPRGHPGNSTDGDLVQTKTSETLEFIDTDVVESIASTWEARIPESLVKMRFDGDAPPQEIVALYDESSLPRFYKILRDENRSGYELDMAVNYIGLISKRGNEQAVKELSEYFKRGIDWDRWRHSESEIDSRVFSKWDTLDWIGFIGGDDTTVVELLKQAMTVNGAQKLTNEWLADMPSTTFSVLNNLRGHAVTGLAYCNRQDVRQLIKEQYEKERKTCLDAGKTSDGYFNLLVDAMTRIDIINDIGLDGHRKLYDESGAYLYAYQTYNRKYLLFEACEPVKTQY